MIEMWNHTRPFRTTKAHMFFSARPAGAVHAPSDRYTFGILLDQLSPPGFPHGGNAPGRRTQDAWPIGGARTRQGRPDARQMGTMVPCYLFSHTPRRARRASAHLPIPTYHPTPPSPRAGQRAQRQGGICGPAGCAGFFFGMLASFLGVRTVRQVEQVAEQLGQLRSGLGRLAFVGCARCPRCDIGELS